MFFFSADGQAYGKWSGNGCTTISNDLNQITCECNHMKSFALLSSNKVFKKFIKYDKSLPQHFTFDTLVVELS